METLYLHQNNIGAWALYRKTCPSEKENQNKKCKELHRLLFR